MNATKPARVEIFKMFHGISHKKMSEDFYMEGETSLCQIYSVQKEILVVSQGGVAPRSLRRASFIFRRGPAASLTCATAHTTCVLPHCPLRHPRVVPSHHEDLLNCLISEQAAKDIPCLYKD